MPNLFNRNCALVHVDDSPDDHFLFQRSIRKTETPLCVQPFFSAEPVIMYFRGPLFNDSRVFPFPEFILCDYDLKLSRGSDLASALRAIPSCAAIPIIIFSGSLDQDFVLSSYAAGANAYLCKPSAPNRLDILVQTLYACATSVPADFDRLKFLGEYQPPPQGSYTKDLVTFSALHSATSSPLNT